VNGVPAEMLRFPNTPHSGSVLGPISHRRAQNEALLDWMNRYVLAAAGDSAAEQEALTRA
jgi:dipeptidyl aminopeptidase/acylaminoacyl peptidase